LKKYLKHSVYKIMVKRPPNGFSHVIAMFVEVFHVPINHTYPKSAFIGSSKSKTYDVSA